MSDLTLDADALLCEHAPGLLESAGTIVLLLGIDGRILSFNRSMEKLCGYDLAEVQGRDWFETFIPAELRESIRGLFARAIAGHKVVGNVNPILTRDGEPREIEWHGQAVVGEAGEPVALVNLGLDVTAQREMQAKLIQTEKLAAIGMLASMFAHEVGNPLNAMYLQAQLLRRKIDSPLPGQPLGPRVDGLLTEIQRLNSLLEDFRSFQRPERLLLEPTDVSAVLSHVADVLAPKCDAEQVVIEAALDLTLPRVQGNANKLKQVFLNLCKNALEAMPEGGTLGLVSRRAGERVVVEVRDSGRGIPDDIDVFEPFASSKPAGMGLGLALVREIVGLHGGEVRYASSSAGTTFTVELPIP